MLPVACVCLANNAKCKYCGGCGWVQLGKIGGTK